jgi:hemolysin activation/secretion protein
MVVASGTLSGRLVDGRIERQSAGARLQVYLPQDRRWLLYASLAGDLLTHPEPLDTLTLGGDTGLRGFPLRWQAGTRRVLFTLEERFYTDAFPLRLFRVGAAGFVDVGRAWGGEQAAGNVDRGWIADVGFGLRIFSTRTAVPRVAHVDVAFPIGSVGDIRRAQLIVRSKTSF